MTLENIPLILVIAGPILAAIIILIATKSVRFQTFSRSPKAIKEPSEDENKPSPPPLRVGYSVTQEEADKSKEELKTLNIEREIASYALTRSYEAEAEGKITEGERTLLVNKYKSQMQNLNDEIKRKELIVNLRDLEGTQSDLVKMFNDKFNEISKKIETLQIELGTRPKESMPTKQPPINSTTPESSEKEKKEQESSETITPPKSKAEDKMQEIQKEVLEVLERLERIETET